MAEAEIRESVAAEMDELLRDMDASYKVSIPSCGCVWYASCTESAHRRGEGLGWASASICMSRSAMAPRL